MGAGSSTGGGVSPDMANKILTQIFTQTDMMKYLTMTDPKVCLSGDFIFPELTQKMQAGLQAAGAQIKNPGQNAQTIAVCFEEAKGYSKAIEIYAALYPLLADPAVKRTGVPLLGGSRRKTRRVQRGGSITSSTPSYSQIKTTPYFALNYIPQFEIDYNSNTLSLDVVLRLTEDKYRITFSIPIQQIKADDITVRGVGYIGRAQSQREIQVQMRTRPAEGGRQNNSYEFLINSVVVLQIFYEGQQWGYMEFVDSVQISDKDVGDRKKQPLDKRIIDKIRELTGLVGDAQAQAVGSSSYGSTGSASYGSTSVGPSTTSAVAGSFFPQGPANIKVALREFKEKKKNVPIALAVARALILLKQIDPANSQGPPTSQICSSKYTFEGKDAAVPRKGLALDKSYYFKSWINLYNDIGQLQGGKYEWTQSTAGRVELNEAAKDLSILYSNPQQTVTPDEKFLSKPLPEFIIACPNKFSGEYLISPQVLPAIRAIVDKLLRVQATYMQKANAILAKIFIFKADGTVDFRPEILGKRGYQNLSAACVETRSTLFQYYMKVESLFIEGVMICERARAGGLLQPV